MKVTTEEQPHREALVNIELEPEEVERYLERAYRKVVQRVNVHGFRKGKAPRRIIEQMYGREYLLSEAVDFMVPEAANQAVQEASLEAAGSPSLSLEQLDPPRISATVPLTPTVDLGEYLSVRVPKEPVEVSGERVDEVLKQMSIELAPWEPVEGPAALDDLLNITVRSWTGEQEIINNKHIDYVPREGSQLPVPGFAEALVGLVPEQHHEFTLESSGGTDESQAKTSYQFAVTVHEVKRKNPAPPDDEFAKGVGEGYETLEALRQKVREDLTAEEERGAAARQQEAVMEAVMGGATLELSPLLVDHEVEYQMRDREAALRNHRINLEQYLRTVGKSREELREESRPAAEARIKQEMVLREVGRRHQLEVSEEELKAEVDALVARAEGQADTVRKLFEAPEHEESLRNMVQRRKATEFLVNVALGQGPEAADSSVDATTGEGPSAENTEESPKAPATSEKGDD